MASPPKQPETDPALVWERSEPTSRPAPSPLSRDRIVWAALAIADAEGLAAVSFRKVGAALGAGPMRLYGYLATKEDMLELMVDAVYAELAAEPLTGGWPEVLRALAVHLRAASRRHPWFPELLGGRPQIGPHALGYLEASLEALGRAPGLAAVEARAQAVGVVNAYTLGVVRNEASALRAAAESGLGKTDWQRAVGPYLQRQLGTGRYPNLAEFIRAPQPSADAVFEGGLECVIQGVAARFVQ